MEQENAYIQNGLCLDLLAVHSILERLLSNHYRSEAYERVGHLFEDRLGIWQMGKVPEIFRLNQLFLNETQPWLVQLDFVLFWDRYGKSAAWRLFPNMWAKYLRYKRLSGIVMFVQKIGRSSALSLACHGLDATSYLDTSTKFPNSATSSIRYIATGKIITTHSSC